MYLSGHRALPWPGRTDASGKADFSVRSLPAAAASNRQNNATRTLPNSSTIDTSAQATAQSCDTP